MSNIIAAAFRRIGHRLSRDPLPSDITVFQPFTTAEPAAVYVPTSGDGPFPLVMWIHGYSETELTVLSPAYEDSQGAILRAMLDMGCVVAATRGHSSAWGNSDVQADVVALRDAVVARFNIDTTKVVLCGVSMGSLAAHNVASAGTIPNVVAVMSIDGVCSISSMFYGVSGPPSGSTGYTASIRTAYGIAEDNSNYSSATSGFDPALRDASGFPAIRYGYWANAADGAVRKVANADVMVTKLTGRASAIYTSTNSGGHGGGVPFVISEFTDFLEAAGL